MASNCYEQLGTSRGIINKKESRKFPSREANKPLILERLSLKAEPFGLRYYHLDEDIKPNALMYFVYWANFVMC